MNSFRRKRVGHGSSLASRSLRPCLETLEERLTPSTVTYTVTDASDTAGSARDVTLPYAISQALANPSQNTIIQFSSALAGQTITLSNASSTPYGPTEFVITNDANVTIDAANAPGLVISGNNNLRPFVVTSGASLTLEDVSVEDGLAQGGAGGDGGFAGSGGGGAGLGGAVYDDGGSFTAEGVTFTNNTAQGGTGGSHDISGAVIGGGGGGLGVSGTSGLSGGTGGGSNGGSSGTGTGGLGGLGGLGGGGGGGSEGGLVGTNYVPGGLGGFGGFGGGGGGGGAGYAGAAGVGGLGGFGGGGGGGGSGLDRGGIGGFGGGTGGRGGSGGTGAGGGGGAGMGGALFANGGTLTLTNDTFTANTAQGGAGGTSNQDSNGYNGSGYGGAVFVRNGTLTATDATFSSNTAVQGGTDVYVLSDGSVTAPTATLVDDILGQTNNSVTDFVAGTNGGGTAPNLSGSSNDLVSNNPMSGGLTGTNIISGNPLLSPLANNGGPTQTMALSPNSSAYQDGITVNGITTDQRGYARPANDPSLGAFEPQATPPSPSPSPSPSPASLPADVELLFLAEDQFALTVDSMMSKVSNNPSLTQAADHLMMLLNNRLDLDNPALGTGLTGLQSAIDANPYYGSMWGHAAQAIGLNWAAELFAHSSSKST